MRRALLATVICLLAAVPRADAATGVRAALDGLLSSGQIDRPTHDRDRDVYAAAQGALHGLHGRRFRELRAVVANVDAAARAGQLVPTRLALEFTTLDANRRWWTSGPLLSYGQRVTLRGSLLVWQAYPGQGIQIQWLGSFGKANAYFTGGHRYDARLGRLLDEARALATDRAGGIAWEYAFSFDHGRPPWVSGLAQGTALSAYSRAAVRLNRPELFQVARDALGIFQTAPPEGVRQPTPAGARELAYSFNPKLHIGNAFVQAVNGLRDFAALANDPVGMQLFGEAEAQLRVELPTFDTGAWSLYSTGGEESDVGYHTLLRDFLRGLCARLKKTQTPDPTLYCQEAARFTADLRAKPRIVLQPQGRPKIHKPASIVFTLDKISSVTVVASRGGAPIAIVTRRLARGRHRVVFGRPSKLGPIAVRVSATDLAGNTGAARGALDVRR